MVLARCRVNIIGIAPRTGYRSGEANLFHFTQVKWKRIYLPLSNSSNLLIQTMSEEDRTLLLPDLKHVELERKMELVAAQFVGEAAGSEYCAGPSPRFRGIS